MLYNFNMLKRVRPALILLFLFYLGLQASITGRAQPDQKINILTPGEGSVVTAPIDLRAMVHPGGDGLIRVTLIDRQGNLLARQLLRLNPSDAEIIPFTTSVAFEIPFDSTPALLTIATQDDAHRPLTLRSVQLTLQRTGEEIIEIQAPNDPWLSITNPKSGEIITQSPLVVSGTVIPVNSRPIVFELVSESGGVIISKQLPVSQPGVALDFEVPIIFTPSPAAHDMLLVIRQTAQDYHADIILDSLPLILSP